MAEHFGASLLRGAVVLHFAMLLAGTSLVQAQQWVNYTDTRSVDVLFKSGDDLWLGTAGALIRYRAGANAGEYYYRANSGLPSHRITAITGDGAAGIWVGTWGGLAHFDGAKWRVFNTSESAIPSNEITCIYRAAGDMLWIGTAHNGVARYDGTGWASFSTANSELPGDSICGIVKDRQGALWVAIRNRGLVSFDGSRWAVYDKLGGALPSDVVNDMLVDNVGRIWVATPGGVSMYNGAAWRTYNHTNSALSAGDVRTVTLDADGGVWASTSDGDIAKFSGGTWSTYEPSKEMMPGGQVHDMLVTAEGAVWLGTSQGVVGRKGDRWKMMSTQTTPFTSNAITTVAGDAKGGLWAGSMEFGAVVFDGTSWRTFTRETGELPSTAVRGLVSRGDGAIYICTDKGLAVDRNDFWLTYDTSNSRIAGPVNCVAFDSSGTFWVGTQGGGSQRYCDGGWYSHTRLGQGLPSDEVTCIALDVNNRPWVGTRHGLAYYGAGKWNIVNRAGGMLPDDAVQTIAIDADGTVWVGTENGGLARRGKEGWSTVDVTNGLPSNDVRAIIRDGDGDLWVGTHGGLAKLDENVWRQYTMANSRLPDNVVDALGVDARGNLIIGMRSGGMAVFNEMGSVAGVVEPRQPPRAQSVGCTLSPNPTVRTATFTLQFAVATPVTIEIAGLDGRVIAVPVQGSTYEAGAHTIACNVSALPAGEYMYRVRTNDMARTGKMVVVR